LKAILLREFLLELRRHAGRIRGVVAVVTERLLVAQHLQDQLLFFLADQRRAESDRRTRAERELLRLSGFIGDCHGFTSKSRS
jgi:hypothetical protein